MRPIDQKLKYQIDKVIKTATTGGTGLKQASIGVIILKYFFLMEI